MCGITGFISTKKEQLGSLKRILESQENRGPDNSNIENIESLRSHVCLGHNRLIINDLTDASNQPFWDETKRYCLVFNGEIYNYIELRKELESYNFKFRTSGDVEVLLNALIKWDKEVFKKLNGMFAFCFFDFKTMRAIMSRDRFGKKPFFYFNDGLRFYFASTPTQMAKEFKKPPNYEYLLNGLKYWIYESDSNLSQYESILSLEAGHYLEVKIINQKISTKKVRYYNLDHSVNIKKNTLSGLSFQDHINNLKELYNDSIQIRLRSDVPVGVSLSGGLDSSTIAFFAKSMKNSLEGVTFGDPNEIRTEGPVVRNFTSKIGMKVNYVIPDIHDINDTFDQIIDAQDSPILSLSYIAEYLVYKKAKEIGLKVMLGGQGGDEAFMGYRKYMLYNFKQALSQFDVKTSIKQSFYLARLLLVEYTRLNMYLKSFQRYLNIGGIKSKIKLPIEFKDTQIFEDPTDLTKIQIQDILKTSVPVQVKSEDRSSMDNSIETRAPLLDYRVVEYGIALPTNHKINRGVGKWIIREMLQNNLPNEITNAKFKRGYDTTFNYIKSGLGEHMREMLYGYHNKIKPFLSNNKGIEQFSDQYLSSVNALQEVSTLIWLGKRI